MKEISILCVEDGSVDVESLENEGLSDGKILIYRQGANPPFVLKLNTDDGELKSEQNKVAVEKLEELRARFDNSPIIFFHDTELNEKERALVRDEYEDAKFIFRDNIDQLLAELKGEK